MLREADRVALEKLLADDDPTVWRLLAERFAGMGPDGQAFLDDLLQRGDPRARRGAQWVQRSLQEHEAAEALARFCAICEAPADLSRGCWLLAKTRYPDLNAAAYEARLAELAQELRERLTGRETPRGTIEVVNRHLFGTLGFRGNKRDYYDPDNSYLNRVLDRRLGIPISLSVMYLLVGRRLHLPLQGVNLPGHFVLQWRSRDAHFYIDPFNEGRLLTAADCRDYCVKLGLEFRWANSLDEASTRQIMARLCRNLHAIYAESDPPRVGALERALALLTGGADSPR
jgi:regulator of sirC expression with transglutaminase-like and TPR domain